MYHTQERWPNRLTKPILCTDPGAWLGEAFYFWYSEEDAHFWGIDKKRKTRYFEVYNAVIESDKILDTVFNEEHYLFWVKNVEHALKRLTKAGTIATITTINEFFKDRGIWSELDGILFQDISTNKERNTIFGFYYKKRIQLGLFKQDKIKDFGFRYDCACT